MENLDCFKKIMKVAVLCSQVQPVWVGDILVLCYKTLASVAATLQVRPSLRYATANNEDGAHVDVYASGFWGGNQTSEGIFYVKIKAIASSYRGSYPSILTVVYRHFEHEKQCMYEQRN